MNRSLIILVGALALGAAIFTGSYLTARQATVACCVKPADDLDWLRTEFHLSDAEMAHVRELHEGYKPKCAEMCAKIAAKKSELDAALNGSTNVTAELQAKMNELGDREPGHAAGGRASLSGQDEGAHPGQPRADGTIHVGRHRP
jgi:hypothetical protein